MDKGLGRRTVDKEVRAIIKQASKGVTEMKCRWCGKETNKPSGFCNALCQQDYLCETEEEMRGEKEEGDEEE
jgi:hypothetical protein